MNKYPIRIKAEDLSYTTEYRTYLCRKCGYKADVFGALFRDNSGAYNTHVCLNCKILIEGKVENAELQDEDWSYEFMPCEPKCFVCDKDDLIPWDSNLCKCPKCESKMEIVRLDLNLDQIGTINIV